MVIRRLKLAKNSNRTLKGWRIAKLWSCRNTSYRILRAMVFNAIQCTRGYSSRLRGFVMMNSCCVNVCCRLAIGTSPRLGKDLNEQVNGHLRQPLKLPIANLPGLLIARL